MKQERKRLFILSSGYYPRGGATANYLQYLAMSTKEAGYYPTIIAPINPEFAEELELHNNTYQGIRVLGLTVRENKILRHISAKRDMIEQKEAILVRENIGNKDIVYVSGANKDTFSHLLRLREKYHFKLTTGVLELFEEKDFECRFRHYYYQRYWYTISNLIPRCDMVFPISTFIKDFYESKGTSTFIIPPLTEVRDETSKEQLTYKFVLPANGKMKDNLESMICAFLNLSDQELSRVELHLCGISEEKLRSVVNKQEWNRLKKIVIIHKWMKYDELEKMYKEMHYLLLARDICQMNLANFPSKVPETMAYGIVPIASRVGDYTELYLRDGENSFIIKDSKVEQVTEAVHKAISISYDEYKNMSKAARGCVYKCFDYRTFSAQLKDVLDSL